MSNNSTDTNQLTNVTKSRSKSLGLNLSAMQASLLAPPNLRSEIIIIPSTSQPNWGSYFIFDVKERNSIISDLIINFNVSAISGRTSDATSFPHFNPATFWFTKIELVVNNVTVDTLYPLQEFITQQFCFEDEDRVLNNNMGGNYNSIIHRNTLSTTASNYYVKLRTFFNETHMPILSDSHNLQIRVYMDTIANVVALSGGSGTAAATINYANVIAKVTKLPADIASARLFGMTKTPEHSFFHNVRYSPFAISSGVSQTTIVLTPFVGNIVWIFFVVRATDSLTGDNAYKFTKISNFAILDSTSSNCVGGQSIASPLALQYLNSFYSKSSYTSETDIGCNLAGDVKDNKSNVYCWSFSSNPQEALHKGLLLGHRRFVGNEQLQISFTGSLAAPVQIDVFAYCQSAIEQGAGVFKVYAL